MPAAAARSARPSRCAASQGRNMHGVRLDHHGEREQQPASHLSVRHHGQHRGNDQHRKEQVHLAEHQLVPVELRHQHEGQPGEEPGRPAPDRQQRQAEGDQDGDQAHRDGEPRGLAAVSGSRPAGMREHRKRRQVLELEVRVFFAVERLGGARPDAGAPVDLEVRHLRGRLEGEEGGKRRKHGGCEQPRLRAARYGGQAAAITDSGRGRRASTRRRSGGSTPTAAVTRPADRDGTRAPLRRCSPAWPPAAPPAPRPSGPGRSARHRPGEPSRWRCRSATSCTV